MEIRLFKKKQLYIYGIGRWQADFEYVFPQIEIKGYLLSEKKEWRHHSVIELTDFLQRWEKGSQGIIVCVRKNEEAKVKANLEALNFIYAIDFFFAEDFFPLLDEERENCIADRKIIVWGTGRYAKFYFKWKGKQKVAFCVDNNIAKKGSDFEGTAVFHPSDIALDDWKNYCIVIANANYYSIHQQLSSYGLQAGYDYLYYMDALSLAKLFAQTYQDTACYELECKSMLNHLDIGVNGVAYPCCGTFLDMSVGNILSQTMDRLWKGALHRILCVSILNRTFTFCKTDLCPALLNKPNRGIHDTGSFYQYPKIPAHPVVTNIAVDDSCNLFCETCRKKIKVANNEEQEVVEILADRVIKDVIPYTKFIMMAGNGEVFLSKEYERIWSAEAGKHCNYFQVLSNGTLFTPQKWEKLMQGRTSDIMFCISIDAAKEETYKKIRRGGNWQNLMNNMEFAAELRRNDKIKYFRLNFVVQRENYQEMPEFVRLAKRLHADRVLFTKILNWGTYTDTEFARITMVDSMGRPNADMQKILQNPILQDPIVDIGTFYAKHSYEDTKNVENYYLWEIDNYSDLQLSNLV